LAQQAVLPAKIYSRKHAGGNVIAADRAEQLKKIALFRNIVVHAYLPSTEHMIQPRLSMYSAIVRRCCAIQR
jgi:hypothetical protein